MTGIMILRKKSAPSPSPAEYGPEVLCAGWNPAASAVPEPAAGTGERPGVPLAADAESFLAQYYRLQQT